MSFKDFFDNLLGIGVQPDQALRLEQLVIQQAEQVFLKEGEPRDGAEAMDRRISITRNKVWREIDREIKKGQALGSILDLLKI